MLCCTSFLYVSSIRFCETRHARRGAVLRRMRLLTNHVTAFFLTRRTHTVSIHTSIHRLYIGFDRPNTEKKDNYNPSTEFRGEHQSRPLQNKLKTMNRPYARATEQVSYTRPSGIVEMILSLIENKLYNFLWIILQATHWINTWCSQYRVEERTLLAEPRHGHVPVPPVVE
jgi:hypothetical protein